MVTLQAGLGHRRDTGCLERAFIRCGHSIQCADLAAVMDVAGFRGHGVLVKILRLERCVAQALYRQLAGERADRLLHDAVRHAELLGGLALMHPFHNSLPQYLGVIRLAADKVRVLIVARPRRAGVVIRIAGKPHIVLVGRRTGLAGNRGLGQLAPGTGALRHDILHRGGQEPRRRLLQDAVLVPVRIRVQDDIAVMIRDLCVKFRLQIFPAVCDRRVSGIELDILHAARNSAQSQCLLDIGINHAVDLLAVDQCGEAEVDQVIVAQLRRDLRQRLDGYDIHGILDSFAQGAEPPVGFAVPVADRCAVRIGIRRVILRRGKRQARRIERRRVR